MIGDQDAFQPVKDKQIGLVIQVPQQLRLALRPRQGAHCLLTLVAHIAKRADQEILEVRIAFIEAPPQEAGEAGLATQSVSAFNSAWRPMRSRDCSSV